MGMHKSKKIEPSEVEVLASLMETVNKASDFKRIQCVYLRAKGFSAEEVSSITRYSVEHVKSIWTAYFKGGVEALAVKARGGRHRFNLSLEEEKTLLAQYTKDGENGSLLEIGPLHKGLCEKVGRPVALTTAYRLAYRHGWRKVAPRPEHPARNPRAAEYFKVFFP